MMLLVYFYKQRTNKKGDDSVVNPEKNEIPLNCSEIVDTNSPKSVTEASVKTNGTITSAATNPSFENDE